MTIFAFIFARGGSKGLPGKNIKLFCGKPLLGWTIEQAYAVPCISRVIVSTDSEDIASVARSFGAEVPFLRPRELAEDQSSEWLAWKHALNYFGEDSMPDIMISLPATSPLRLPVDIDAAIYEFKKGGADVVVGVTESSRSPYFNMVCRNNSGEVNLVITPDQNVHRRQDVPITYDLTTVAYVADPSFVLSQDGIFSGRVRVFEVPPERSIDIDTQLDFDIAEFLYKKRSHTI